tara:strand:- start:118 stop:387 length:270 start_codon:yes stop_codon:yes gene_type:complete
MSERGEAIIRIFIAIISGLILSLWKILIQILVVIHWFYTIITGTRSSDLANFTEIWNTQVYVYLRYTTFVSNERPFPFNSLTKNLSSFT